MSDADPKWSHDRLIRNTMTAKTPSCVSAGVTTVVGCGAPLVSGFQAVVSRVRM